MNKEEINRILANLIRSRNKLNSMKLGIDLFTSSALTIIEKKFFFELAFNMGFPDRKEAILNLWAVGVMLEDDLSVVKKYRLFEDF